MIMKRHACHLVADYKVKSSGPLSQEHAVQNINEFVFSYVNQWDYDFLFIHMPWKEVQNSLTVFLVDPAKTV